jgi:hypothetical protein
LKESIVSVSNFRFCLHSLVWKRKTKTIIINAEQSTDAKGKAGESGEKSVKKKVQKHTTAGIRWWSPTQLLICRSEAYVWQSGRDAQLSSVYGRM